MHTKPTVEPPLPSPSKLSSDLKRHAACPCISPHLVLGGVLVRLPVEAVPADEEPRANPAGDRVVRSPGSVQYVWPAAPRRRAVFARGTRQDNRSGAEGKAGGAKFSRL